MSRRSRTSCARGLGRTQDEPPRRGPVQSGRPDSLDAVEPFLRNLFRDPAIIRAPAPLRHLVARVIARRRGPKARDIYRTIGGRSPLRAETEAQAAALAGALDDLGEVEVAVAMRYWHPMS